MDKFAPICCVIGHVDVGKTKLLDYLRHSSTKEVSGITQQIGATYYNIEALQKLSGGLAKDLSIKGIIILDTPGHESFSLMRMIGTKIAQYAILVIDIIKGIERETINSIKIFKKNKIQFIIVLNKIDKIYNWKIIKDSNLKKTYKMQNKDVLKNLDEYVNKIKCQLAELEINADLYYKLTDDTFIPMVPISASSGEGISDLILLISNLANKKKDDLFKSKLFSYTHGYIIDKRIDPVFGEYYMAINNFGLIKEGDTIFIKNIKLTIKFIISIDDNLEMKDRSGFKRYNEIDGSSGLGLIFKENEFDNLIELGSTYIKSNEEVKDVIIDNKDDNDNILYNLESTLNDQGLTIIGQSLSAVHALMTSLNSEKINIANYEIGGLNKKIITKTGLMIYGKTGIDSILAELNAVILIFDPVFIHSTNINKNIKNISSNDIDSDNLIKNIDPELLLLAKSFNVKIIAENTIYKLIEKYIKFKDSVIENIDIKYGKLQSVKLQIIPKYVFMKITPLLFGVKVLEGNLTKDMKLKAIHSTDKSVSIGIVSSLQKDKKDIEEGKVGDEICIKVTNDHNKIEFGKHFDETYFLVTDNTDIEREIYNKVKIYLLEYKERINRNKKNHEEYKEENKKNIGKNKKIISKN